MTAFTIISNALVAVGAKPFATTMQAFRDNLLAALEGDATAHTAGVSVKLPSFEQLVVGDSVRASQSGGGTTSTSFVAPDPGLAFVQTGQVRIKFTHSTPSGTSEARVRRSRGGVLTVIGGTFSVTASTAARSVDVDVIPGDLFEIQHRHTAGTNTSTLSAITYCVSTTSRIIPCGNWFGVLQGNP